VRVSGKQPPHSNGETQSEGLATNRFPDPAVAERTEYGAVTTGIPESGKTLLQLVRNLHKLYGVHEGIRSRYAPGPGLSDTLATVARARLQANPDGHPDPIR